MAVIFLTDSPAKLLAEFDSRIKQTELKGKITTWERDSDGDYTHKADDWKNKAWFKTVKGSDRLTFNIIAPKDKVIETVVYGYYHGHLVETFLNHFDSMFSNASASAGCTSADRCGIK